MRTIKLYKDPNSASEGKPGASLVVPIIDCSWTGTSLLFRLQSLPLKQRTSALVSLATLLFSEYRRKVLTLLLLHADRQYHQREIARLTGTLSGTLSRELTKMVEASLLLKVPVGNQMHYRTNRDCPIFAELASILRKTSGLAIE